MQPPNDLDVAPAQRNSGCALKWLALFGAVAGVMLVACCGACGFLGYMFVPHIVQTAGDVDQLTHEIVEIDIPEDFHPQQGQKIDNVIVSVRQTIYRQKDGRGTLEFLEVSTKIGDKAAMEAQFKQQMQQQQPNGSDIKVLKVEKSETRQFTVRGQTVTFTFEEGEDLSSSTRYHQVSGEFQGKNGPATLALQVEDAVWNEEQVVEMLNSMK